LIKLIILVNNGEKMKISSRGKYGTRALLDLAQHSDGGPVQLKDISKRQQIPLSYLEHLISPFINTGIVRSVRGARGGVWLARSPQEIRLSEVVELLEGSIAPVECVDNPEECPRSEFCATRDIWGELEKAMNSVLESVTLQDLVVRQRRKEQSQEATMYYI